MELVYIILVGLLALSSAQDRRRRTNAVRRPPSITRAPLDQTYKDDTPITLECEADGTTPIDYKWFKNGVRFELNRQNIVQDDPRKGTFKFDPPMPLDRGHYQCYASNSYGLTMSDSAELVHATIGTYPTIPTKNYPQPMYQPAKLDCQKIKSVPPPTYRWVIAQSVVDDLPTPVSLSERINIDDEGNLHFANVLENDEQLSLLYKCVVYNAVKDISAGGSYSRIDVLTGSPPTNPPAIAFQSDVTYALLTQTLNLRCIFSGYPTPTITWSREDGKPIPSDRMTETNFKTTLTIIDIHWGDEAVYVCTGSSSTGQTKIRFDIEVREVPNFKPNGIPMDASYTDGETAKFVCDVNAKPAATTVWMRNGEPLNPSTLPPRMTLSSDRTVLMLEEVCKSCPGGSSDLQVFQCNASNDHGYAFSSAYLNVLTPTKVVDFPQDMELVYFKDIVFNCSAVSDDSTEVVYKWYFDDKFEIFPVEDKIILEEQGKLLRIITAEDEDGGLSHVGEYRCDVTNGHSSDSAAANLTKPIFEPPKPTPVVGASLQDLWWVFVIVICIILLIILILVCILCIQRNKGDTYPVDEKERWNGNDPEKELMDDGFQDYQRPEDGPLKGSQASLTSTIKMDSDEDGSLAEYGDLDAGKFNEDGSFIGQYATDKKKAAKGGETNV